MNIDRFTVSTPTSAPSGATNAYLVGDVLIDPAAHTDTLSDAAERAAHVTVTHTHPDHVGAIAEYADSRTVWALSGHEDRFEDATGITPDETFSDGDMLAGLEVLETPGHSPDHVAFSTERAVICGDLVMAENSVFVGGEGSDMAAYLGSLERVRDLDLETLYPGHGEPITRPRKRVDWLINHRLERERRIKNAVEDGNQEVETIRHAAYETDLSGVEELATQTVEAHLEKLASDGEIQWDGERARI